MQDTCVQFAPERSYLGGAKYVARLQGGTLTGFLSPELTLNVFTGRMAPYVEEYCRLVAPTSF
jgi:hypothetical protein